MAMRSEFVTGESYRSTSSIAFFMRPRSLRRRASWPGFRSSAITAFPIRSLVLRLPARRSRLHCGEISTSLSRSPDASVINIMLTRSSPGFLRRRSISATKKVSSPFRAISAAFTPAASLTGLKPTLMMASDQSLKTLYRSGSMPRISAIRTVGIGLATCRIRPNSPLPTSPMIRRATSRARPL